MKVSLRLRLGLVLRVNTWVSFSRWILINQNVSFSSLPWQIAICVYSRLSERRKFNRPHSIIWRSPETLHPFCSCILDHPTTRTHTHIHMYASCTQLLYNRTAVSAIFYTDMSSYLVTVARRSNLLQSRFIKLFSQFRFSLSPDPVHLLRANYV